MNEIYQDELMMRDARKCASDSGGIWAGSAQKRRVIPARRKIAICFGEGHLETMLRA